MPRKAGYRHTEETRARIQAAQIIHRLEEHVLSRVPTMDNSQVNAAKALLNKVIPDLQSVAHTGENGGPVDHRHEVIRRQIVDPRHPDA